MEKEGRKFHLKINYYPSNLVRDFSKFYNPFDTIYFKKFR